MVPGPRPPNLKIIQSQWTGSLCVKVMFGLARNQLKPANQYARTKCFCLHLEYLNAAELPHVNQRKIEKKRVVRNTEHRRKTKNPNKLLCEWETKKHYWHFLWYKKNINTKRKTLVGGKTNAESWGVDWQWLLMSTGWLRYCLWLMPLRAWQLRLEPEWLHVPRAWGE